MALNPRIRHNITQILMYKDWIMWIHFVCWNRCGRQDHATIHIHIDTYSFMRAHMHASIHTSILPSILPCILPSIFPYILPYILPDILPDILIYIHTYMHVCIHTYIHACIHTCIHACIHTYLHAYIHTCMHTYIHACIHTCMHAYIHTYMHTFIHACMHAYIHTYIHAFVCRCICCRSDHAIKYPTSCRGSPPRAGQVKPNGVCWCRGRDLHHIHWGWGKDLQWVELWEIGVEPSTMEV